MNAWTAVNSFWEGTYLRIDTYCQQITTGLLPSNSQRPRGLGSPTEIRIFTFFPKPKFSRQFKTSSVPPIGNVSLILVTTRSFGTLNAVPSYISKNGKYTRLLTSLLRQRDRKDRG